MTPSKGTRKPIGDAVEHPQGSQNSSGERCADSPFNTRKGAKTGVARDAQALDRLRADLEKHQAALAAARAEVAEREQAIKAREAAIAETEGDMAPLQSRKRMNSESKSASKPPLKSRRGSFLKKSLDFVDKSVQEVKPKTGEVLCKVQSKMILMLLSALRKEGRSENLAVLQVSTAVKIGCLVLSCCCVDKYTAVLYSSLLQQYFTAVRSTITFECTMPCSTCASEMTSLTDDVARYPLL